MCILYYNLGLRSFKRKTTGNVDNEFFLVCFNKSRSKRFKGEARLSVTGSARFKGLVRLLVTGSARFKGLVRLLVTGGL